MQIDTKTADLIVEIYRNIQSIKNILKTKPFIDSELLVQSGNVLDALMNQALAIHSNALMLQKITQLTIYVKELKETNQSLISIPFQNHLNQHLDTIISDLEILKSNIN